MAPSLPRLSIFTSCTSASAVGASRVLVSSRATGRNSMGKATRFRGAKAQDARAVERVGEVVGVDAEGVQQALGVSTSKGLPRATRRPLSRTATRSQVSAWLRSCSATRVVTGSACTCCSRLS